MPITVRYGPNVSTLGQISAAIGRNVALNQREEQASQQRNLETKLAFEQQQAELGRQQQFAMETLRQEGQYRQDERSAQRQMVLAKERADLQLQNYQAKDELEQNQLKRKRQEYLNERNMVEKEYGEGRLNDRQYDMAMEQLNQMPQYKEVTNLRIPKQTTPPVKDEILNRVQTTEDGSGAWVVQPDGRLDFKQTGDRGKMAAQQLQAEMKQRESIQKQAQTAAAARAKLATQKATYVQKLLTGVDEDGHPLYSQEQARQMADEVFSDSEAMIDQMEPTIGQMGGARPAGEAMPQLQEADMQANQAADLIEGLLQSGRQQDAERILQLLSITGANE